MLQAPALPLRVRAVNAALGLANTLGMARASLETEALMELARQRTGLEDFGERTFLEGLTRLVQSMESESRLSPIGRFITREDLVGTLCNRLQVIDYHKRYPEIGQAPIERPIFIIGMGRSGTTIMHELLALDDALRTPLTWEVDHPCPPPETGSFASDPRIEDTQKNLDRSDLILPEFKKIHRMGATLPQECVRFTTGEFLSLIYWTTR